MVSRLEDLMLAGEGCMEDDADAIGEELNHVINLLKDKKYEWKGRNGREQTLSVGNRPENEGTTHHLREDVPSEEQEPIQPLEGRGSDGASETGRLARRSGVDGETESSIRSEGNAEAEFVSTTGATSTRGTEKAYHVRSGPCETGHGCFLGEVKFTKRFNRIVIFTFILVSLSYWKHQNRGADAMSTGCDLLSF